MQTECAAFSSGIHEESFSTRRSKKRTRLIYINKHILTGVIANFYSLDSWNIEFAFALHLECIKFSTGAATPKGTRKCGHHLLHLSECARVFVHLSVSSFAVLFKLLPRNFFLSLVFNGAFFVHNNRLHLQIFSSLWFPFACRFPRIYCNAMWQQKV